MAVRGTAGAIESDGRMSRGKWLGKRTADVSNVSIFVVVVVVARLYHRWYFNCLFLRYTSGWLASRLSLGVSTLSCLTYNPSGRPSSLFPSASSALSSRDIGLLAFCLLAGHGLISVVSMSQGGGSFTFWVTRGDWIIGVESGAIITWTCHSGWRRVVTGAHGGDRETRIGSGRKGC